MMDKNKTIEPLTAEPEGKPCPKCGADDYALAVDVTIYDRTTREFNGVWLEGMAADAQPVRIYCRECGFYRPLAESLAESLIDEHTDE